MKFSAIAATCAIAALLGGPAIAQPQNEETQEAEEQTEVQEWAASEPRINIVCEYVRRTGSLIRERRCRTEAQLEAERENSLDTVREIEQRSRRSRDVR